MSNVSRLNLKIKSIKGVPSEKKADKKLTIVMCCHIFYGKSIARLAVISTGERRRDTPVSL